MIELLIAMAIGVLLLSGVVAVMGDSKSLFLMESETAAIQENARFGIDQLGYDLRMAGYFGCGAGGNLSNTITGSTLVTGGSFSSNGIKGFEYSEKSDTDFPSEIEPLIAVGTDVVVVNRGEQNDSLVVNSHNAVGSTIQLGAASSLKKGDVLVISSPSCTNMTIFQMAGPAGSNPSTVEHAAGGVSPGNCRRALSDTANASYDCSSSPLPAVSDDGIAYPSGSALMHFRSHAYFIGTSDITGLPSLFRMTLEGTGSAAVNTVEELVSGVEDLEILYGLDTTAVADGRVDQYFEASDITQDEAGAGVFEAWDRVITSRVTLIMRSNREVFGSNTATDLGEGFTFNDRYMRQRISATFRIRNRGLGV